MTSKVAFALMLTLGGCRYTIGVPLTTPVEKAAGQYIGCMNYWRLHPEDNQDMKEMSAFIRCPTDQGSHCLCADWERMTLEELERDENDDH
jgi:hypothetical protein